MPKPDADPDRSDKLQSQSTQDFSHVVNNELGNHEAAIDTGAVTLSPLSPHATIPDPASMPARLLDKVVSVLPEATHETVGAVLTALRVFPLDSDKDSAKPSEQHAESHKKEDDQHLAPPQPVRRRATVANPEIHYTILDEYASRLADYNQRERTRSMTSHISPPPTPDVRTDGQAKSTSTSPIPIESNKTSSTQQSSPASSPPEKEQHAPLMQKWRPSTLASNYVHKLHDTVAAHRLLHSKKQVADGKEHHKQSLLEKLWHRSDSNDATDNNPDSNADWTLSDEDVWGGSEVKSVEPFLGEYSDEQIDHVFVKYGIKELLRKRGFEELYITVDTSDPYVHKLSVTDHTILENDDIPTSSRFLIDLFLRKSEWKYYNYQTYQLLRRVEESGNPHANVHTDVQKVRYCSTKEAASLAAGFKKEIRKLGTVMRLVKIEWINLQDPVHPSYAHCLPGQKYPGLGFAKQVGEMMHTLGTNKDTCDGLLNVPDHAHNAVFYNSGGWRFINPAFQAHFDYTMATIKPYLERHGLVFVAWAFKNGHVMRRWPRPQGAPMYKDMAEPTVPTSERPAMEQATSAASITVDLAARGTSEWIVRTEMWYPEEQLQSTSTLSEAYLNSKYYVEEQKHFTKVKSAPGPTKIDPVGEMDDSAVQVWEENWIREKAGWGEVYIDIDNSKEIWKYSKDENLSSKPISEGR